mgnify:FL=1
MQISTNVSSLEINIRLSKLIRKFDLCSNKTRDNTSASSAPLSVRYGFMKKPETSRVPKETKKSVTVTQKPYRNSVVISTNKVETNEIINQQQPEKQPDDSTVFNFLKSIIKFG